MAEELTIAQKAAVTDRGGNLLVSAAAGSGKTKVLTERLLSYIQEPVAPANIDDFLIITFTKAAAAELRVKIASKLTDAIADDPDNQHLQRQMQRLHMAHISTVDSFCTDLLREYAYRLDISSDFRMVDTTETPELQQRVLDQIMEKAYASLDSDPEFLALVNSQGFGRNDRAIPEIILKVYESSRCHLNPDKWLDWCIETVTDGAFADALETPWGAYLRKDMRSFLDMHINTLRNCKEAALRADGMSKVPALMDGVIAQLEALQNAQKWNDIRNLLNISFGTLSFDKKCEDTELRERIKLTWNDLKAGIRKYLQVFDVDNEDALHDLTSSGQAARGLIALVKDFAEQYAKLKKSLRVMDFNDLEHKTLDLLVGKSRSGPTALAREIGARYREVMVDEYQDSNQVQDAIYMALTNDRSNCFMVGDVKQSIYQFRLAEPGIFIDKYNKYPTADCAKVGEGRKIMLSHNFRSSGGVIDCVNDVFKHSMSEQVGGLDYGPDEQLYEGVPHTSLGEPEIELLAVDTQGITYYDEAAVVADRILELIDGKHMVREKNALRPIRLDDIAILLRSRTGLPHLKRALEAAGIPYVTADAENILQCTEISVLISLLKVINNPLQDIPLVSVLCSSLFQFTADDMARLRGLDPYASIYRLLQMDTEAKTKDFLTVLEELRTDAKIYSVCQLLENILQKTRFDSIYGAMSDGLERIEHIQNFLKLASNYESVGGKDLRQFIEHLDAAEKTGLKDDKQIQVVSAVQITTIHKSKGLEYPVVFCVNLARQISFKSTEGQVLCDRELGLGLSCLDPERRLRYPAISKQAIKFKIKSDTVSEELRVLYVALTRAKDRLIMTYGSKYLAKNLETISAKLSLYDKRLISAFPGCPGLWVLQAAMLRTEAGELFAIGGNPGCACVSETPWSIRVVTPPSALRTYHDGTAAKQSDAALDELYEIVKYRYPFDAFTKIASKQTATQIKGRMKDTEIASNSEGSSASGYFRKPTFVSGGFSGKEYGNAYHGVMQYVRYEECLTLDRLQCELDRLEKANLISLEQRKIINPAKIVAFVNSEIGTRLLHAEKIHREFKFSILTDAVTDETNVGEQILLQGVVDCMMIEPDGITVVDFKSDRFSMEELTLKTEEHRPQVEAYAKAVERIFKMPVKEKILYFFSIDQAVTL